MAEPVVVLLAGPGRSTRMIYNALKDALPIAHVVLEQPVGRAEFLRRRARRLGWRRVAGQVLFQLLAVRCLEWAARARAREIVREYGLDDSPIDPARVRHVPSVNAAETVALLTDLNPAVVLVNGTRIIARDVLKRVPAVFINAHAGITPLYRGVHGGYWALARRDPGACGVTVHVVDAGIDTGAILGQALIRPTPRDNFTTYPLLQTAAAIPLLRRAVRAALDGPVHSEPPPDGRSALWTHPTLMQYLWNRLRYGVK
jgi:folate-dependent phosphoribosylglycinamide formyltransferase PurN